MKFLSKKCIIRYLEQYPEDDCFYGEPDGLIIIEHDDKVYSQPSEETDKSFLNRLTTSAKNGENLFLKEWEEFDYEDGCDY